MATRFHVVFLVLVLEALAGCCGFNLDARIPVIKEGAEGSYFGYSVAQHQSLNDSGDNSENWLLVGAPLDENLQPGTNRSGALWKCPITTLTNDCVQVVTDGKRSELLLVICSQLLVHSLPPVNIPFN